MDEPAARTFGSDFRQFFVRGLVVLLPTVLTLWIVVQAYRFVDNNIAEPVNGWIRLSINNLARVWEPAGEVFNPTAEELSQERAARGIEAADRSRDRVLIAEMRWVNIVRWWKSRWYMDLIGLFVAIVVVYITGRLLGGFFGRRIYRRIETIITTLPIFKQVYPYVKQIVDFLFADDQPIKFNRVVVIEYPRKGIWSIGLVTGATMKAIAAKSGDSATVFIPSSPTPFTGYTITVPRSDLIEVPITIEEALRFTISGGVLIPERQLAELSESGYAERAEQARKQPDASVESSRRGAKTERETE